VDIRLHPDWHGASTQESLQLRMVCCHQCTQKSEVFRTNWANLSLKWRWWMHHFKPTNVLNRWMLSANPKPDEWIRRIFCRFFAECF
jgi:hypothetical protein